MQPSELQPQSFAAYPPEARALLAKSLPLLRQLPMPLLPLLLREISSYDWRFPRERQRIDAQLGCLREMPEAQRTQVTAPFAALALPASLAALDWIGDPAGYMEQLTAALWSTQQMPAFRNAANAYAEKVDRAAPQKKAPARLVMVVLDGSLGAPQQRAHMYRKLRREGVLLTRVDPGSGLAALRDHLRQRSSSASDSYAHWYIDGGGPVASLAPGVATVSYGALAPTRQRLLERARDAMQSQKSGPEELRTLMARLTPSEIGLNRDKDKDKDHDPVMAHFQLSLLTEGSGTQVFATTFVQWAARECLRRAEPHTLLARFTARQRQQGMNDLLSGAPSTGLDLEGSLVDADQAAWYTWLNLQRLPGATTSRFLAWQEDQSTAIVIGPGLPRGTTSNSPMTMQQVLKLLA